MKRNKYIEKEDWNINVNYKVASELNRAEHHVVFLV